MAELNVFGYRHGHGVLHRLDVRCKLGCLLLLTMAVVAAELRVMPALSAGLALLWLSLRLPLRLLRGELAAFSIFLLVVFAIRAVATPGTVLVTWGAVTVTREGLAEGAAVACRLAMILVLGLVFVTTTPPAALKAAVQWLLRPIPFVPAHQAATMVGLIVRFIPELHRQFRETRDAFAARSGLRRGLSVRRLRFLVLPVFRRIMLTADQLSLAMVARGYREERTDPALAAGSADALALAAAGAVLTVILLI